MWNAVILDNRTYRVIAPSAIKLAVMTILGKREQNNWIALRKVDGMNLVLTDEEHEILNHFSNAINAFELTFFPKSDRPKNDQHDRQVRVGEFLTHFLDAIFEARQGKTDRLKKLMEATTAGVEIQTTFIWNLCRLDTIDGKIDQGK